MWCVRMLCPSRNQLLLEPPVTEPIPCNIIDKKNINYILMLFKQFQVFQWFFFTFFNFLLVHMNERKHHIFIFIYIYQNIYMKMNDSIVHLHIKDNFDLSDITNCHRRVIYFDKMANDRLIMTIWDNAY